MILLKLTLLITVNKKYTSNNASITVISKVIISKIFISIVILSRTVFNFNLGDPGTPYLVGQGANIGLMEHSIWNQAFSITIKLIIQKRL